MSESEITENTAPSPEEPSKNEYAKPFSKSQLITGVETDGPTHTGPWLGAIDFLMPLGSPVLAPLEGEVVRVIDKNDKYGPTDKFKDDLNYITIKHENGEFSEVAHLAKGSSLVKKGDRVELGQQIAITGTSGHMTEPHLHFLVFRLVSDEHGFKGLKPRFKE